MSPGTLVGGMCLAGIFLICFGVIPDTGKV